MSMTLASIGQRIAMGPIPRDHDLVMPGAGKLLQPSPVLLVASLVHRPIIKVAMHTIPWQPSYRSPPRTSNNTR